MTEKQTSLLSPDPNKYHSLAKPFTSQEEADKAMSGFFDDVSALRDKHGLPDVYFIARLSVEGVGDCMTSGGFGNVLYHEEMTAFAFGRERGEAQARIMGLTSGKIIAGRRKK